MMNFCHECGVKLLICQHMDGCSYKPREDYALKELAALCRRQNPHDTDEVIKLLNACARVFEERS